jgi:hypothetical protein
MEWQMMCNWTAVLFFGLVLATLFNFRNNR